MNEFNPKYSTEAGPPILVSPGADADQIGRHYANLHRASCGRAYEELGQEVEVRYTTSKLPDGTTKVEVVVDHY